MGKDFKKSALPIFLHFVRVRAGHQPLVCCWLAPTFQIVGIFHFLASILKINDARNAQRLRILSAWLFPNIFIRLLVLYYVLQHTLLDSLTFFYSFHLLLLNLNIVLTETIRLLFWRGPGPVKVLSGSYPLKS